MCLRGVGSPCPPSQESYLRKKEQEKSDVLGSQAAPSVLCNMHCSCLFAVQQHSLEVISMSELGQPVEMYIASFLANAIKTNSTSIVDCAVTPYVKNLAAKTPPAGLNRYLEVEAAVELFLEPRPPWLSS